MPIGEMEQHSYFESGEITGRSKPCLGQFPVHDVPMRTMITNVGTYLLRNNPVFM